MPIADKPFRLEMPDKSTGGMSILLCGSTRSGKTTFMKHLLENDFQKHITILMSPNIHAPAYSNVSREALLHDDFDGDIIKDMFVINKKTDNHYDFCVVLDDIVTKKFDKDILKLFTTHRNANISGIMCIQSPVLLNSAMRGNINVVLLGFMNSDESCEKVIRMFCYASVPGKNIEEKIHAYKELTRDHHWLVCDNLTGDLYRTKLKI